MNACLHLTVLTAADRHPQTRPLWHILAHLHNTLHAMYNQMKTYSFQGQLLSIITFSMLIFIFYFEVPLVISVYKEEQKMYKFFLQLFYYFFKTNHYNFLIIKSTPSKCTLFPMNINTVNLFSHFISYFMTCIQYFVLI